MSKIAGSQLDLNESHFEVGGTLDRQVLLKDGGVGAAKLGFAWKTVTVEASSFAYDSTRSNYTLSTASITSTSIEEQPALLRNGVNDQTLVTTTSTANEWSLSGATLSVHGDITTTGNTYKVTYMVAGVGGGASGADVGKTYSLRVTTSNSTPVELTTDGAAAASGNMLVLDDDSTYVYDVLVTARRTDANDESAAYQLFACLDRNTGVATTALVGTVAKTVIAEDTAGWDVNITADTTLGAISIKVTGENSKDIDWRASVRRVMVTG